MIHQERYSYQRYSLRRQTAKPIGFALRFLNPDERLVLYVESPPLGSKADVRVYSDETKAKELLSIQSRQIVNGAGTFEVYDTQTHEKVGTLLRQTMNDGPKDEWVILNPAGTAVGHILEDKAALAVGRKLFKKLVPRSYDIEMNGAKVADMVQQANPFSFAMDIDFGPDVQKVFDRRLGLSGAVLLAILESK